MTLTKAFLLRLLELRSRGAVSCLLGLSDSLSGGSVEWLADASLSEANLTSVDVMRDVMALDDVGSQYGSCAGT